VRINRGKGIVPDPSILSPWLARKCTTLRIQRLLITIAFQLGEKALSDAECSIVCSVASESQLPHGSHARPHVEVNFSWLTDGLVSGPHGYGKQVRLG
jgi:hypothetical protein